MTKILNTKKFADAVSYMAINKSNEDKAYKSFAHTLANATVALDLRAKSLAKARGEKFDCYTRNPAFLIEGYEMVEDMLDIRLHKMARTIFSLQRELAKEVEGFKSLLNCKIEIGEAITEETVVAGRLYNSVVAVDLQEGDRKVLLQLAKEIIDVVDTIAHQKTANQPHQFEV